MGDDCWADDVLDALTVLVLVGGVATLAATFGPLDRSTSLGVLHGAAGLVLAAMGLVAVELWVTLRDIVRRARQAAQWAEERRYAEHLHRQKLLAAIAFQFGYALAKGLPAEEGWNEALERSFTGPDPGQPSRDMAA